jgi:CBS domain containing-hemolysin-like protein
MAEILIPIGIIIMLVAANGFFVAAEFAIAAAPRTRVAQLAESGSTVAHHVLEVLDSPVLFNRYITTAQVGISLAGLGLGMYGEHVFAEWLVPPLEHLEWVGYTAAHTVATILSVSFLTYLHVVFGEMIPKSLALQSASSAAIYLSSIMVMSERIFRPFTVVLIWIGDRLMRLLGFPPARETSHLVSAAELAYIVEESSERGLLDPEELIYLENAMDFHERTVGQIMTPRTRMAALPVEASMDEVLAVIGEDGHSRYPIYEEDRDHILGILHVKDVARQIDQNDAFEVRALLRPAVYVPESLPLDDMLQRFRREHVQIAIVLDEFGGTAGLVTLEDLAEELIGEIQDEFDEELPPIEEITPDLLRVRGDLLLDELTQHYDLEFENEEAETVGGLIMAQLGQVAQPGDSVDYEGLRLQVESVDGLAVRTALLQLPAQPDEQADAPAA